MGATIDTCKITAVRQKQHCCGILFRPGVYDPISDLWRRGARSDTMASTIEAPWRI